MKKTKIFFLTHDDDRTRVLLYIYVQLFHARIFVDHNNNMCVLYVYLRA